MAVSTTGIHVSRGVTITAAEEPERFSFATAVAFVLGIASLVAGIVTRLRR